MPRSFRESLITLALLAGMLAVLFWPVFFGGRILLPLDMIDTMMLPFSQHFDPPQAYNPVLSDGALQLFPLKFYTAEALRHGQFTFWNPFILNGYPQYLEGTWTYNPLLLLPGSIFFRFHLLLVAPLLVAGFGFWLLLRAYGIRVWVARLFATAYMLNGLFVTHLLNHFIPAAFSFAPFVLLGLYHYHKQRHPPAIAFAAFFLALGFLAGNVQTGATLIAVVAIYWYGLIFSNKERTIRLLLFAPAAVILLALCASAIYWLPMTEFVREVNRDGTLYSTSYYRGYSFVQRILSLPLLLTFFMPQLAGSVRGITIQSVLGVFPVDFQGAIGFFPLLIAIWGIAALWKKQKRIIPFAILTIAGLAIPIATPLFRFVYHRFLIVFIIGACGSGAIAFESLLQNIALRERLKPWIRYFNIALLTLTGMLALSTTGLTIWHNQIFQWSVGTFSPRIATAAFAQGNEFWINGRLREIVAYISLLRFEWISGIGSCALVLVLLRYWIANRISDRALIIGVYSLTVFQLLLFARLWLPMSDPARFPAYPRTSEIALLASLGDSSRLCMFRQIEPRSQTMFVDNQNIVYGIREVSGYESLTPRSLYTAIGITPDILTIRLLGRFNVGMIGIEHTIGVDSLLEKINDAPIQLYKIRHWTPRAFLTRCSAMLGSDRVVLDSIRSPTAVWPCAYFVKSDQDQLLTPTISLAADSVQLIEESGERIQFHTAASDSAYLVLTDTYYPGWIATVDGNETPVLRCNYAMRTIVLPPGQHHVEFRFAPKLFWIGSVISGVTALLLGGFLLAWRLRKI